MHWYDPLLYPFSFLYDGATRFRNHLFDIGKKKSVVFEVPTIAVGNLSMGGTGKTPMVELLLELLKGKYKMAALSRGYGRKTTGFFMADNHSDPSQIGDEPFQIFSKFGNEVAVAVGEERVVAIPQLLLQRPETEVIVLDDAFQHRYVKADFYLLLTTYQRPFFRDKVVPLGTLREAASGAKRADMVIVTKCPDGLGSEEKTAYKTQILDLVDKDLPVLFAGLAYGNPVLVSGKGYSLEKGSEVVLVSGIANDELFVKEASLHFKVKQVERYSDHHHYKKGDVQKIVSILKNHPQAVLLTTEKDATKLKSHEFREYWRDFPIFALPIQVKLDAQDKALLESVLVKIIRDKAYTREV